MPHHRALGSIRAGKQLVADLGQAVLKLRVGLGGNYGAMSRDLRALEARAKGLNLRLLVESGCPPWVRADEGRPRQVMSNVAGNAVKFTEEGSVFSFELDLPPCEAPLAVDEESGEDLLLKSARILLAEDLPVNRKVAVRMLEQLGLQVRVATNGTEALHARANAPVDLVLMDCSMPVMDGFAACRDIRRLYGPSLPVVALTANALSGDREQCLEAGMDDYLTKPLHREELRQTLLRHLSGLIQEDGHSAGENSPTERLSC